MTDSTEQSVVQDFTPPFPPSWIDRFIDWIGKFPGPEWFFYIATLLALGFVINAAFWMDGSLPFGSIHLLITSFAVFIVYAIWLYKHLTFVGSQALKKYLPLLKVDNGEVAQIEYRLAKLPRWIGRLIFLLGSIYAVVDLLGEAAPYGDIVPRTALPYIGDVVVSSFMISTLFSLIFRSIRQLQMVRELHAQAANINLLKLEPAHAFSSLSSHTAIGLTLILVFAFLLDPASFDTGMSILSTAVILIVAVAIFILPVIGIRDNLEEEKSRTLNNINDLLQATIEDFHNKVENEDYRNVPAMKEAINTLIQERDLFTRISTWPWNLRTLRSFASTMLLPIFLLVVSRLVEKVF